MSRNKNTIKDIRCLSFLSTDGDSKWSAVALELDIWGFGDSKKEAMADLDELINTQVEFANSRAGNLEILDHPADEKWFKLWDKLEKLGKGTINGKTFVQQRKRIPPHNVEGKVQSRFVVAA